MVTKETVKEDIIAVQQLLSKIPSKDDYRRYGKHSMRTIRTLFGCWANAMVETLAFDPRITKIRTNEPKPFVPCVNCGEETQNPKFCSKTCSTSFINSKKLPTGSCSVCGTPVRSVLKYCKECTPVNKDLTLAEVIEKNNDRPSPLTYAYGIVRIKARSFAKELGWNSCIACGYDKHIEIAHRKPIGDFPLDTLLSVINAESNLASYCANCHWEYDHGMLPNQ